MKLTWRLAALQNGFKDAVAYRIEFLFEILGSAAVPAAIQLVLWYALFTVGGATEVAGRGYDSLIAYTLTSILFSQIRGGDHDFELQEMIRSGHLSNYLLKPVGVVEFVYIRGVAPKILVTAVSLILGATLGAWLWGVHPLRLLPALGLALAGNIIHYQLGACLATTAFLWEEAYAILMVKNLLVSFLSGELIPLDLFPEQWQWIWKILPFHLYVFTPVQHALGEVSHHDFLMGCLQSVAWMIALWAGVRITWGLGIKRYLSLGG